jgi:hypothetical protein
MGNVSEWLRRERISAHWQWSEGWWNWKKRQRWHDVLHGGLQLLMQHFSAGVELEGGGISVCSTVGDRRDWLLAFDSFVVHGSEFCSLLAIDRV